jgi:hypothetical protein
VKKKYPVGRKDKYQRLFALGTDRIRQIDAMLFKGESTNDVATVIQNEWHEYKDVSHGTLSKQILRYRNDILRRAAPSNIQNPDGSNSGKEIVQVGRLEGRVHAHETLSTLCLMQQERLNKIYMQEQKLPSVMDAVRKEIELFSKLIGQLATLEMDMGLLQRVPKKIQGEFNLLSPEGSDQDLRISTSIQSYQERMEATHKVFALIDQLSNGDMVIVEDESASD